MDMKLKTPILKNWVKFHNVLVGEVYNHSDYKNGQRIVTNNCYDLDVKLKLAKCSGNESWILGKEGNLTDYYEPKKLSLIDKVFDYFKG